MKSKESLCDKNPMFGREKTISKDVEYCEKYWSFFFLTLNFIADIVNSHSFFFKSNERSR